MIIHADDYGITVGQARAILALSDACGGSGALNSLSIFANSPAFPEAAALALPYARRDADPRERGISIGLHVNLVEGPCCAAAEDIPLLVDARGMFRRDFAGLLALSASPRASALRTQMEAECAAQIERYLEAFPWQRGELHLDSHQHVHAIPLVFDALMAAARRCNARVTRLRVPAEPTGPHKRCGTLRGAGAGRVKALVLNTLCRRLRGRIPEGCATPLFCGVVLSGHMDRADGKLVRAFQKEAACRAAARCAREQREPLPGEGEAELLFHPVSVPREHCLDPDNEPFARACASASRDAEAAAIVRLGAAESQRAL